MQWHPRVTFGACAPVCVSLGMCDKKRQLSICTKVPQSLSVCACECLCECRHIIVCKCVLCVDVKESDNQQVWACVCLRGICQFPSDCEGNPQSRKQGKRHTPRWRNREWAGQIMPSYLPHQPPHLPFLTLTHLPQLPNTDTHRHTQTPPSSPSTLSAGGKALSWIW